jgi:hypothetical protein
MLFIFSTVLLFHSESKAGKLIIDSLYAGQNEFNIVNYKIYSPSGKEFIYRIKHFINREA